MTNGRFRIMLAHHRGPYKTSFVIAMLVLLALFVFFPPFEFKPYTLQAEPEIEVVDVVPDIDIPPPPKEIPPPPVPVPSPDPNDDPEMPPTTFRNIDELPLPPTVDLGPAPDFRPFDQLPEPEYMAKPTYPQMAREAGFEGTVHLKVLIGLDHKVHQAVVISSDVTPEMERAAVEAALKCQFKPAKQRDVEVEVWVSIRINFRLND